MFFHPNYPLVHWSIVLFESHKHKYIGKIFFYRCHRVWSVELSYSLLLCFVVDFYIFVSFLLRHFLEPIVMTSFVIERKLVFLFTHITYLDCVCSLKIYPSYRITALSLYSPISCWEKNNSHRCQESGYSHNRKNTSSQLSNKRVKNESVMKRDKSFISY